ncbi:hypothetical protein [Piscinibacter sp. XHJ-5]|uniref:hypothetical protein n=1 Tax=Piscinibacter sp. XHJ-5 TaxID=3037797 RepID=UPI002452BF16|nr:hypothetical protein [Piscinibacter sp. XHJ-5]
MLTVESRSAGGMVTECPWLPVITVSRQLTMGAGAGGVGAGGVGAGGVGAGVGVGDGGGESPPPPPQPWMLTAAALPARLAKVARNCLRVIDIVVSFGLRACGAHPDVAVFRLGLDVFTAARCGPFHRPRCFGL